MNRYLNIFVISVSLVTAMVLMLIPLPDWARPYRPEWLVLVLIYWNLSLPKNIGIGIAWMVGLCVDATQGVLLGQYALGFAITAYITVRFHLQIRNQPLHQQAPIIGVILLPYMGISLWVPGMLGENPEGWLYWAPVITSVLVWPGVYFILRAVRRAASIH